MAASGDSSMNTPKHQPHQGLSQGNDYEYDPYNTLSYSLYRDGNSPNLTADKHDPSSISSRHSNVATRIRKHTPVQPVYVDFPTAFSSITSGRSRQKLNLSDSNDNDTIAMMPLRTMTMDTVTPEGAPRLPAAALFRTASDSSELDADTADPGSHSMKPFDVNVSNRAPTINVSSRFGHLRSALLGKAFPTWKSSHAPSPASPKWPHDIPEHKLFSRKQAVDGTEGLSPKVRPHANKESATEAVIPCLQKIRRSSPSKLWRQIGEYDLALDKNDGIGMNERDRELPISDHDNMDHRTYDNDLGADSNDSEPFQYQDSTGQETFARHPLDDTWDHLVACDESTIDEIVRQYSMNAAGSDAEDNIDPHTQKSGLAALGLESDDEVDSGSDETYSLRREAQGGRFDGWSRQTPHRPSSAATNHRGDPDNTSHHDFVSKAPGQVPTYALPAIPDGPRRQSGGSFSENLQGSSSYGDTRNLLEMTQQTQVTRDIGMVSKSLEHFSNEHFSNLDSDFPLQTTSRGPYHILDMAKSLLPSSSGGELSNHSSIPKEATCERSIDLNADKLTGRPRVKRERDVSAALHKHSAYSAGSQAFGSSEPKNGGFQSSTGSSNNLLNFIGAEDVRPLTPPDVNDEQGFYHRPVIPQRWMESQRLDRVRIPIHRQSTPETTPESQTHHFSPAYDEDQRERDDDVNDWETIGTGLISRNITHPLDLMAGVVNRAGSSMADVSEDSVDRSANLGRNDFASSELVTQHPAQSHYTHKYRLRKIKDGALPILLPVYKQDYCINGFPANSFRSQALKSVPNQPDYQSPAEEVVSNRPNPFNSSPPEVMTGAGSIVKADKVAYVQRPSQQEDSIGDTARTHGTQENSRPNSSAWMDDFGEPGPSIRLICRHPKTAEYEAYDNPFQDSYMSRRQCGYGSCRSDARTAGSSIADESTESLDSIGNEPLQQHLIQPYPPRLLEATHGNNETSTRTWTPLVHGPPGALYQDIRARPEPRGDEPLHDHRAARQVQRSSQVHPTNQMRPLSLLTVYRPETPVGFDGHHQREFRRSKEFVYRSPLAPIKSKSWRYLYSAKQLISFKEHANTEDISRTTTRPACLGITEGQAVPTTPSRLDGEKKSGSRSSKRKAKEVAERCTVKAKDETVHNLPSVPSTHHLKTNADIAASAFFSLYRPLSVTSSFPKNVTDEAFASIFTPRTRSNKPSDVISTLSNTVNKLESATQQKRWNAETDELRAAITAESEQSRGEVLHLDQDPNAGSMQFPRHILSGTYQPFNTPPPPVPMDTAQSLAAGVEASAASTQHKTYTTVLTIKETTDMNGDVTYMAHSSPLMEEEPAPTPRRFLERMNIRQEKYEEYRERRGLDTGMWAISVKRQRKLKMKKHKYKKLMRRTRNLRRRLDRN
ncbi:MAG: hypothetical protein M1818_002062 [Claussenomyces sp. TS43310]|nr:MAG: hypothetical protein M1818_002062 [Claussenomyces sp. TS43310]